VECSPAGARPREWYRAWSAGLRFPLVGASAKDSNRVALGAIRTYARLQQNDQPELTAWVEAVRAGRTYVTSGPMLHFAVNDQVPGAIVDQRAPGERVSIHARLESSSPMEAPLEILVNGEVLERVRQLPEGKPAIATIERAHAVQQPCWIAARCAGSSQSDSFAHSSPIFVRVDGKMPSDSEVVRHYDEWLSRTVDWVDNEGRFEMPRRKEQLRALIEQARQALRARALEK
jgi:hypothetical protein